MREKPDQTWELSLCHSKTLNINGSTAGLHGLQRSQKYNSTTVYNPPIQPKLPWIVFSEPNELPGQKTPCNTLNFSMWYFRAFQC